MGLFAVEVMANIPRYSLRSSGLLSSVGWYVFTDDSDSLSVPQSNLQTAEVQMPANRVTFPYVSLTLRAIVNTTSDRISGKLFNLLAPELFFFKF